MEWKQDLEVGTRSAWMYCGSPFVVITASSKSQVSQQTYCWCYLQQKRPRTRSSSVWEWSELTFSSLSSPGAHIQYHVTKYTVFRSFFYHCMCAWTKIFMHNCCKLVRPADSISDSPIHNFMFSNYIMGCCYDAKLYFMVTAVIYIL